MKGLLKKNTSLPEKDLIIIKKYHITIKEMGGK